MDVTDIRRHAEPESLLAVLRAIGVPIDRVEQAADLTRERLTRLRARDVDPVAVVWDAAPAAVELTLPDPPRTDLVVVDLQIDNAEHQRREHRLSDLDVVRRRNVERVPMTTYRVPIAGRLPLGYHRVRIDYGSAPAECVVIVAPTLSYSRVRDGERLWGVFAPLYAVHSERSLGAGDFTDLERLTRFVGEQGGGVVGTLPLLASFLDERFEPSPFVPVSRQFWNELYVDLDAVPEVTASGTARRMAEGKRFARDAASLRALGEVDYRRQAALKRGVLEHCAKHIFTSDAPRRRALEAWVDEHPSVSDYAAFRAMSEKTRTGWRSWPDPQRRGTLLEGEYDERAFRYHLYVQWLASQAIERVADTADAHGPGLYLDLPVGVHPDGFDVWREQELFTEGISVGCPPDPLAPTGQDWGFPALVPEACREDHYQHYRSYVRHHMASAGVLRIDHVMGLHRLFYIPSGMKGTHGVYVRNRPDELYAVLCLESARNETMILGEDLGTVPDGVRPAMARHGFLRMHVAQSVVNEDVGQAFENIPRNVVASVNTHDMPTFASFWTGKDIDLFSEIGTIPAERVPEERANRDALRGRIERHLARSGERTPPLEALDALTGMIDAIGGSDATLALVTLEDLWLEERPQNVPGTVDQPNWSRKMRFTLDTITRDPTVRELLGQLDRKRRRLEPRPIVIESIELETGEEPELPEIRAERYDVVPGPLEISEPSGAVAPAPLPVASLVAGDGSPPGERPESGVSLTSDDIYLFAEGSHTRLYEKLGAQLVERDGVSGTHFAVWAPGASSVSVLGAFNDWTKGETELEPVESSGIWAGFVPGVGPGAHYKYHVRSRVPGLSGDKADPLAFAAELPPETASIVHDPSTFQWSDHEWMRTRADRQSLQSPVSIYEVHLGSWRRAKDDGDRHLTYAELAEELTAHVKQMGYTHVELLPIMEHPFYGSWGYQVTGYYAPTARYGSPDGLKTLIDTLHREGIGVILDWVPSHFPTDGHGLGFFDGTHLYEHADPRRGFHPDWKTFIFNYTRGEVVSFLLSNAAFWLDRYHIDAFRVDAVASMLYLDYSRKEGEWLPNAHGGRENLEAIELIKKLNEHVGESFPGVLMIAEESTSWPMVTRPAYVGGLGFHLKWDMGWMHDTLGYLQMDPMFRSHHHHTLTFRAMYHGSENFVLALSHDEVVHGKRSLLSKMPGDWWKKFATLRALYGYMYALPGKKLLFMGGEIGQWTEWNHDAEIDWALADEEMHESLRRYVTDLNLLYRTEPALHVLDADPRGFSWIDCHDHVGSTLTFMRTDGEGSIIVVICNFTPIPRDGFRIGVPRGGFWREVSNGDESIYGGSGIANPAGIGTIAEESHGQPHTLEVTLPPLAVIFLKAPDPPPVVEGG